MKLFFVFNKEKVSVYRGSILPNVVNIWLNKPIATFILNSFPYCNGICILNNVHVEEYIRSQGIGKAIVEETIKIAKSLNYSNLIATVCNNNEPMIKIMRSVGFKEINQFKNQKTNNDIIMFSINI